MPRIKTTPSNNVSPIPDRSKRFQRPLKPSGIAVQIPQTWEELTEVAPDRHEAEFVAILKKHALPVRSPVPLVRRYSKSRRWSLEELTACLSAHDKGIPVAMMSAALNRNPQDIIFRLLDERHGAPGGFKEVGLKSRNKWTPELLAAGRELFEAGLTAWRVAALFGVDFEGAEKLLYQGREDYGHAKKNPFAICTDHKQIVNRALLQRSKVNSALDAFAGEGRFARIFNEIHPDAQILCIEQDQMTYGKAHEGEAWPENVKWRNSDNLVVLAELNKSGRQFDLIDLDPFVSCRDQLDLTWSLLKPGAALFLTFGGEYRRSFIATNRKAIQRRYGWLNESLPNSSYLETIPSFFLGWVAQQAAKHGFIFRTDYCVRYPNNCRYWLTTSPASREECAKWVNDRVNAVDGGYQWRQLQIPRFAEVRYRTAELQAPGAHMTLPTKKKGSRSTSQMEFAL